ncbi:SoxR reducing system RseC family protein [Marinomonas transparens]|uniref:SoxR reducing system RseC family protein n=1 Tax=Marinomonas transparens TaxID=2795388 RepID=A0A934JT62_9GAMM|nr:SoxR reducing system RseC family protein [Marinomonas transparens]MBJ7536915.1 SoxR reducing system RseC family protein [Marinomonas transparens]
MIEESGTVLAVEVGFAEVETIRTSSCTSCRARHGCGHHAIAQVSASNRMLMRAIDPLTVEVGQKVVVGIPEDTLLQASLWMYLIPLLGLIGGAVLPSIWGGESNFAVVLSLFGFLAGLWLAKNKSKKEMNNPNYFPKILRIQSVQSEQIPLVFTP